MLTMSHSKTKFHAKWLEFPDASGHKIGQWCVPSSTSLYEVSCKFCMNAAINVSNSGVSALKQHSKSAKHMKQAKLFLPHKVSSVTPRPGTSATVTSTLEQCTVKSYFVKTASSSTAPSSNSSTSSIQQSVPQWLQVSEEVQKAEVLWVLKCVAANYSFSSTDKIGTLYTSMFPDSVIARNFSMSHQKLSYILAFGLGPYFRQQVVSELQNSEAFFTLHFDETVTCQSKKQLDLLVRFFSKEDGCVKVKFLHALMFGHAFSDKVTSEILEFLKSVNLPLKHLLSISSDGPNVNKSIKAKLDMAVKETRSSGLVDVGFCTIHVMHNAFKAGTNKFGTRANDFVVDVYYWFHMFPARGEDFQEIQEKLELDKLKFLRHVDSRWLTLLPAIQRIQDQLPALKKYFLEYLPTKEKKTCESERFKRIHNYLKKEIHLLVVELCFLASVKPIFDLNLQGFQSEGPMVHLLYPSCVDLLKTMLGRFIKSDIIQNKSVPVLLEIKVTESSSQVSDKELNIGERTRIELKQLKSEGEKRSCFLGMRSFLAATTKYLQEKLPLKNKVLQSVVVLHPDMRKSPRSTEKIQNVCRSIPAILDTDISQVVDQWRMYQEEHIPEKWKDLRIDHYWAKVLQMKNAMGEEKFMMLGQVVKSALTLAHGNADCERSLSVNKKIVTPERTNLSERTLIALRLAKDGIKSHGNDPCNVPMTKSLMSLCKSAHSEYKNELERQKKKEQEEKMKKMQRDDDEKKKAEAKQQQEREIATITDKNKAIDQQVTSLESTFKHLDKLSKEAGEKMKKAISDNDLSGIKIAHDLQELARTKIHNTRKDLESLHDKKRQLVSNLEKYAKKMKPSS